MTRPPENDRVPTATCPAGALTPEERRRLLDFKARYVLRVRGFSSEQADRLLFCRWLAERGRLGG
jgi:hypothetical protein